ncbi:MAG: hypothetical protein K6B75_02725 [Lachnospiraceae bacterium]|nr:hypothetical protein [Lachnospiraceae bacterium]
MSSGGKNAVITVEAALLCPFLCLIVISMLYKTIELYDKVTDFSEKCISEAKADASPSDMLPFMAVVGDMVEFYSDGSEETK